MNNYPLFYRLLGNNLLSGVTNNFVWFALTFWAIIETGSVVVASFIAGIFAVTNMFGAMFFGGFVDHHLKITAMRLSSWLSLAAFLLGAVVYALAPTDSLTVSTSPLLWILVTILMIGTVAGNLRNITLATTVTILFETDKDKANGLVGMVQGMSFSLTSIFSGIGIGFFGMGAVLIAAVLTTLVALVDSYLITIPEKLTEATADAPKNIDVRGTIMVILAIPGLLALIAFNTFNNLLGGVFMALMDAYGLALVSVEVWGTLWGVMSIATIAGGILVSKYGTGKNPVRTIMLINLISWSTCLIFPLQPSIIFLAFGMFSWLFLFPIAEAAEQTVIQRVVPLERQGRVFGLAQSVESMASPITAFLIGPLTAVVFIPFMTTGLGAEHIGSWFGTGPDRGIALVFITAGLLGLIITTIAFLSRSYRLLSRHYAQT
jgi:DHA3 family multidrug efflux protein-like MFS transporter